MATVEISEEFTEIPNEKFTVTSVDTGKVYNLEGWRNNDMYNMLHSSSRIELLANIMLNIYVDRIKTEKLKDKVGFIRELCKGYLEQILNEIEHINKDSNR